MKKSFYLLTLVWFLAASPARAGLYYEHKVCGDQAMIAFLQNPLVRTLLIDSFHFQYFGGPVGYPIPYHDNEFIRSYYPEMIGIANDQIAYSYGDFSALAGDHSLDVIQLFEGLLNNNIFSNAPPAARYQALVSHLRAVWQKQAQALDDSAKESGYLYLSYVLLANEDRSHFQSPPKSRNEMLRAINANLLDNLNEFLNTPFDSSNADEGVRLRKTIENAFLHLNNSAKYTILHILALTQAESAATALHGRHYDAAKKYMEIALVFNAFADHFLQDAFAAGHLAVHRTICGFDNKGVHDYYCRLGIDVYNEAGDHWHTYGDGYYDSTTFAQAKKAGLASLMDLYNHFMEVYEWLGTHRLSPPTSFSTLFEKKDNPVSETTFLDKICSAYFYMPVPLDSAAYSKLELKHASKPGAYFNLGAFHYFSSSSAIGVQSGLSLLSFNLTHYQSDHPKDKNYHRNPQETIWWAGGILAINYSYIRFEGSDIHTWMGTAFDITWMDQLALECKIGAQYFNGSSYFIMRPQIGYEWHKPGDLFAPSLKFFFDISSTSLPKTGLLLSLRIY